MLKSFMIDLAKQVASQKCLPNQINNWGNTALLIACQLNDADICLELIGKHGLNTIPQQINHLGETAFFLACKDQMLPVISKLLEFGYTCLPAHINCGYTPLFYIINYNLDQIYQQMINLFQSNIDPGQTPTVTAPSLLPTSAPATATTEIYCAIKATLQKLFLKQNQHQNYILDIFSKFDLKTINQVYNQNIMERRTTLLMDLCTTENKIAAVELINQLLEECLPGYVGMDGLCALYLALENQYTDLAMLLLDKFGILCIPITSGCVTSDIVLYACESGYEDVVIRLMEILVIAIGLDETKRILNRTSFFGYDQITDQNFISSTTILNYLIHCTFDHKMFKLLGKLIEIYSSEIFEVNVTNIYDGTLLILLILNRLDDLAVKLIEMDFAKCQLDYLTTNKQTVLMIAISNGQNKVACKLIECCPTTCRPEQRDGLGDTALIYACRYQLPDVAEALLTTFKDQCLPEHTNHEGRNAFIYASYNQMTAIVDRLRQSLGLKCFPELSRISFPKECHICSEGLLRYYVINPCGHTGLCFVCLNRITACPFCRKPIESAIKIWTDGTAFSTILD